MTPEQSKYYQEQLGLISRGGNATHSAYVVSNIGGMGSWNLGPVSPPVVGFSNDDDGYYVTYFHNWDEVNELINQIVEMAKQAFGEKP